MSDDQLYAMAQAAGALLRGGNRRTVFCKVCRQAWLSGPTLCPNCGRLIVEINDVVDEDEDAPASGGKRFFHHLEFEGRRQSIAKWALEKELPVPLLYQRIRNGWTTEKALTTPGGMSEMHGLSAAASSTPELKEAVKSSPLVEYSGEVAKGVGKYLPVVHESVPRKLGRRGPPEKLYEFQGKQLTLGAIAALHGGGLSRDTLRVRLIHGWTLERALSEPIHKKVNMVRTPRAAVVVEQPKVVADHQPTSKSDPVAYVSFVGGNKDYEEIPLSPETVEIEKRLIRADGAADDFESLPKSVQTIREYCWRLDEIAYEIGLLNDERKQIIEKLNGEKV
jgi:hypothetical protein